MGDIKSRISEFANHIDMSVRELERACSLKRGVLSSKSDGLGSDKLSNIIDKFPLLNIYWLITGKGEMLNSDPSPTEHKEEIEKLRAIIEEQGKEIAYWKGRAGVELKSEPA